MRTCVTHGIAGSAGISSLLRGVLNNGVKIFNFVGRNIVIFMACRFFFFGFFSVPLVLCVLLITFDMDDNTSGQIVSGLDVTYVLVNLPS